MHGHFGVFRVDATLLVLAEFLGEDDVVTDLLANRLLDLVALELDQLVLDDIVLLELVPVLLALVEQYGVSEVEQGCVVGAEVLVHDSLVDDDLLALLAVGPVVVELEGLDELVFVVGVPLVGLDDWHAALIGLDDVHGEVLHVVLVVLRDQVTLDCDGLLILLVILIGVVVS